MSIRIGILGYGCICNYWNRKLSFYEVVKKYFETNERISYGIRRKGNVFDSVENSGAVAGRKTKWTVWENNREDIGKKVNFIK